MAGLGATGASGGTATGAGDAAAAARLPGGDTVGRGVEEEEAVAKAGGFSGAVLGLQRVDEDADEEEEDTAEGDEAPEPRLSVL